MKNAAREYPFPVNPGEPPLMKEFSSPDLPEFGFITDRSGRTSYFLKGTEIGLKSSISVFTCEMLRNSGPLYGKKKDDGVALNNSSRTPSRRITVEAYLPAQFRDCSWETEMWSLLFPVTDHTCMTPGDRLPLAERAKVYPGGRSPVPLAGIPCYPSMISDCFKRLGKNIADYSLIRLSVEYPPIPSSIDILVELPSEPG